MDRGLDLIPGDRVICKSTEDEPAFIAEFIRHIPVSKAGDLIPLVKQIDTGDEWMIFGWCLPHTDKLWEHINIIPEGKPQWAWLCDYQRANRGDMDQEWEIAYYNIKFGMEK